MKCVNNFKVLKVVLSVVCLNISIANVARSNDAIETQPNPVPAAPLQPVVKPTEHKEATTDSAEPDKASGQTSDIGPLMELKKLPRRLRTIEGQMPPVGYVEVYKKRKGLVIAGSTVFGAVYLASILASVADRTLLVPIAGPMIAGFRHKKDPHLSDSEAKDDIYAVRLVGTLGTIAQTAGVTMFIIGMASKKKMWLRQDVAGVKLQLAPTLIGNNSPSLGIYGTF